jgi:hypothetical protein
MKYPKSWPGAICGECGDVVVELTGGRVHFVPGKNGYDGIECYEYKGVDVENGGRHDVLKPIPLTDTARDMLAITRGRQ